MSVQQHNNNHSIPELQGALEMARRSLAILEEQVAGHTALSLPVELRINIENKYEEIARLEDALHSSPNYYRSNLPVQAYFFGREKELKIIENAISPKSRTWGVLIDGPGGVGKTALAIRAGYLAPEKDFKLKIFLSAKKRKLTPTGIVPIYDFSFSEFMSLLNELACQIDGPDISQMNQSERVSEVSRALENKHALIIIDNLEDLKEDERARLYDFLDHLPASCKAIVTSRRRNDVTGRVIRLDRLQFEDAMELINQLSHDNFLLKRANQEDRQNLYQITQGNPLLIKWVVGQLGREGSDCRTIADACRYMDSVSPTGDPLEYVFGDLLKTLTKLEIAVLAALSHFKFPAHSKWITGMVNIAPNAARMILEDLTDRSVLVADPEFETFFLPPLAARYLKRKRSNVIASTGQRLADEVFVFVVENGYVQYERFPNLENEWPKIEAALPHILQRENKMLQDFSHALQSFLDFSGRWDERLSLSLMAEKSALEVNDIDHAGWAMYDAGRVYYHLGQADELANCAQRLESYWGNSNARKKAFAKKLSGWWYRVKKDYPAAIKEFEVALDILRTVDADYPEEVAMGLNSLGWVQHLAGDDVTAEKNYREALWLSRKIGYHYGTACYTGYLADILLACQKYSDAESLAREALDLMEKIGRQELIARDCRCLAEALARQEKFEEGLYYARRAVEIEKRLRSPYLEKAQEVLKLCEGTSQ